MSRRDVLMKAWRKATGMDKQGRKRRMRRLADAIVAEWRATAATEGNMSSTLQAYQRAISIREVTENGCVVELPGDSVDGSPAVAQMARMLEFGMGPGGIGTEGQYDVRTFLLRGKTSVNVPFKYSTKMIRELGKLASGGPGAKATLGAARALGPTRVTQGRWTGPRLAQGYTRIMSNPHSKGRPGSRHETDRLDSLRRMTDKQGRTSRYITFRKASAKQGEGKWIHPGIKARHLTAKVQAKVPQIWRTLV